MDEVIKRSYGSEDDQAPEEMKNILRQYTEAQSILSTKIKVMNKSNSRFQVRLLIDVEKIHRDNPGLSLSPLNLTESEPIFVSLDFSVRFDYGTVHVPSLEVSLQQYGRENSFGLQVYLRGSLTKFIADNLEYYTKLDAMASTEEL